MFYPHKYAVLRAAMEMNLFGLLSKGPATAQELADGSGAEKLLVVRIMRVLAAMNVVKETKLETYENHGAAKAIVNDVHQEGAVKFMSEQCTLPSEVHPTNFSQV
jgi:hypothetical protein